MKERINQLEHENQFQEAIIQNQKVDLLNKDREIEKLAHLNDKLIKGVKAIRSVMDESFGPEEFWANGEPCEWAELEIGGKYEEWLIDFNLSEKAIEQIQEVIDGESTNSEKPVEWSGGVPEAAEKAVEKMNAFLRKGTELEGESDE